MRVLIADDHPLFRMGLSLALERQGLTVLSAVASGKEAVEAAARERPDAVVLDVRMPEGDGIWAAEQMQHKTPEVRIVFLSTYDEPDLVRRALDAGASAYLSKETSPQRLADVLRSVMRGIRGPYPFVPSFPLLTARETDVLTRLATGASNQSIARDLGVSVHTVKDHVSRLMDKLEVRSRVALVQRAEELGLSRRTDR